MAGASFARKGFTGLGRSDHNQSAGNYGYDGCCVEFLADPVGGLATKFLDFERDLLVPIVVLNFPAAEIEAEDLLSGKSLSWLASFTNYIRTYIFYIHLASTGCTL